MGEMPFPWPEPVLWIRHCGYCPVSGTPLSSGDTPQRPDLLSLRLIFFLQGPKGFALAHAIKKRRTDRCFSGTPLKKDKGGPPEKKADGLSRFLNGACYPMLAARQGLHVQPVDSFLKGARTMNDKNLKSKHRYEVHTYTICQGWINCWTITDENDVERPECFPTIEAAQAEIEAFLSDIQSEIDCGMRQPDEGYDAEDFRIYDNVKKRVLSHETGQTLNASR